MAFVDPRSGAELEVPPGSAPVDCDSTRIARGGAPPREAPGKITAQFLPESGLRATGEVTAAWIPKRPVAAALAGRIGRLRVAARRRRRPAILASIVLAAAFAAAFAPALASRTEPASRTAAEAPESAPDPDHAGGGGVIESGAAPTGEVLAEADLAGTVDAVLSGQLEKALRGYETLQASDPDNESFALAVRILAARTGGGR